MKTHIQDLVTKQRKAVEITKPLTLSDEEFNLVMMHSTLNIINILIHEMLHFGSLLDDKKILQPTIEKLHIIKSSLSNERLTNIHLEDIDSIKEFVSNNLVVAMESSPTILDKQTTKNDIKSIVAVLDHLKYKAFKYLEIKGNPLDWKPINILEIKKEIEKFFEVVAINNRNRFRVVYVSDEQGPDNYLIKFNFSSEIDQPALPVILTDILIDLMANARKYAQTGTTIKCTLNVTKTKIAIAVSDQGIGIPKDEVEKVVEIHYRASNAKHKKTMGSGLGLTKVYVFTKMLGGKMWIDSVMDKGTEVKIEIPLP